MITVTAVVGYLITFAPPGKGYPPRTTADHPAERIRTTLPIIVLTFLAYPPTHPPYLIDENSADSVRTLKVAGHQRYWSHRIDNLFYYEIDPHINNDRLARLIDVDNRATAPSQEYIRASITPNDALHSWAPPSSGLKIDATPGRPNQFIFMVTTDAVIHGQRSETRGANHSFIPIAPERISFARASCQ